MLFDVIDICSVVLEILIAISFFGEISNKKQIPSYMQEMICFAIAITQSLVIVNVEQQVVVTLLLFLEILCVSFLYKLTMAKRFICSIILMVLYALSEMVIGLALTMFADVSVQQFSGDIMYYLLGALVSKLIVFVLIKMVGLFSVKSEVKIPVYIYVPLLMLPLITFWVVYLLAEFTFQSQKESLLFLATIAALGLIFANMLVFYLFEYQIKIAEAKKQEQLLKQQLEYKVEYYKELSRRQQLTNKTMHDLKNQLFALSETLKNNTKEGADKIHNICEDILLPYALKFTGIESVDALLTAKVQLMKKNDIKFSHSIFISESNCLDILDFCVLLGNVMDNAIEANIKVPVQDRFISLNISQQQGYLSINVSNSVIENVKIGKAGIATTKKQKELHGFGLQSVKDIANKYDGNCTFKQYDNKFEVIIMLKNSARKDTEQVEK